MFRGWSRLCMHAASLSAAEGASAAATALARAARAEAMEREVKRAADHAKTRRKAGSSSTEAAAAGEQPQGETGRGSTLTAEPKLEKDMGPVLREQQLRRTKILVSRAHADRAKRGSSLHRHGWAMSDGVGGENVNLRN